MASGLTHSHESTAAPGENSALEPLVAVPVATRRWVLAFIFLLACAVYSNTLGYSFTYDDSVWIIDNPEIRSLGNAGHILVTGHLQDRHYRPLARIAFALDFAIAGLNPWLYHFQNVLLHGLVSILVYFTLRRRCEATALAAAALFAVLPVHSEAVANATSRSELLAAAFGLAAIAQLNRPWLSALLLFLALLGKEGAVAIPGLAVLLWWFDRERKPFRKVAPAFLALLIAAGAYLILHRLARGAINFPGFVLYEVDNPLVLADLPTAWRTALVILAQNMVICLLPYKLSADYSYAQVPLITSFLDPGFFLWSAVLICGVAAAWLVRRSNPSVALGLAWFLVAIAPVSNLALFIGTIRGERLLYLPSVGMCLLAAALFRCRDSVSGLPTGSLGRRAVPLLLAFVVGGYGALAFARNAVWRDSGTLAASLVRDAPRSARAHHVQGEQLLRERRCRDAIPHFRQALQIFDDLPVARFKLAACLEATGNEPEAQSLYRRLFQAEPDNLPYAEALVRSCARQQDWRCVSTTLEVAIDRSSQVHSQVDAWTALANALAAQGLDEKAEHAYRRAIELGASATGYQNYAALLFRMAKPHDALAQYQAAEAGNRTSEALYLAWARSLLRLNRGRDAQEVASRGLARFPDSQELRQIASR